VFASIIAIFPNACSADYSQASPVVINSLSGADVDVITIVPYVDDRKDKSIEISGLHETDSYFFNWLIQARKLFWRRKYYVKIANNYGALTSISGDDLETLDAEWVKKLGPANSRWILLNVLEDFVSEKTFGAALAAQCSGYLFDKISGKVVWRHKVVHEFGRGGLVGIITKPKPKYVAASCFVELLEGFPKKDRFTFDVKALLSATTSGDTSAIQRLLSQGVDINAHDNTGKTALHEASEAGNVEIVKFLIKNGADVNAIDNKARTPAELAAKRGHRRLVGLLGGADKKTAVQHVESARVRGSRTLTEPEIKSLFVGKTVSGYNQHKDYAFTRYYDPAGVVTEQGDRGRRRGQWSVGADGQFCEGFGGGETKCRVIVNEDGTYKKYKVNRKGERQLLIIYQTFSAVRLQQQPSVVP
jgi:hypothetical protein